MHFSSGNAAPLEGPIIRLHTPLGMQAKSPRAAAAEVGRVWDLTTCGMHKPGRWGLAGGGSDHWLFLSLTMLMLCEELEAVFFARQPARRSHISAHFLLQLWFKSRSGQKGMPLSGSQAPTPITGVPELHKMRFPHLFLVFLFGLSVWAVLAHKSVARLPVNFFPLVWAYASCEHH